MQRFLRHALATILCSGCSGDDAPSPVSVASDASVESSTTRDACQWAAADASCTPRADLLSCLVPNGGSVQADGTILDSSGKLVTDACTNLCKSTDYALTCTGNDPASPAFAGSLRCTAAPGPNAYGTTAWCCPCAE